MKENIPPFLFLKNSETLSERKTGSVRLSFIDKSINKIARVIKSGYLELENPSIDGVFQRLDGRVKILFMIFFLLIVSYKKDIFPEIVIFIFIFLLAVVSKIKLIHFYKRVLFFGFIFGFLISLPSSLNLITRGKIIAHIMHLETSRDIWIYHIPQEIGFTLEGLYSVSLLTLRVVNSLSVSFLVLFTTKFPDIIKALKLLKIPDTFLMIITITYKYIFIFAETVGDIYLSFKSRLIGPVPGRKMRNLIAGKMAFMFRKSLNTCEEVYKAMVSRGFSEDIRIYSFSSFKFIDWFSATLFFVSGALIILI